MTLAPPSPEAELAALRDLAIELGTTTSEPALVERAIDILTRLLPGRALCVRVLDVRSGEPARGYARGAPIRHAALAESITITEVELSRARLKAAVAASARLIVRARWDSPFTGIATGIAIPLEPGARAFGAHLALGLRTLRLADDALGLRDYQARLLENANALILGIDRGWRITACNRALLELVGLSRTNLLGRDVRDFLTADQRQYLTSAFAAAMVGQHHAAVTVALPTRRHGTVRTVWSVAPVGRVGGRTGPIEAVVAIGQDMSQIEALQQQVVRAERLATLGQLAAGVVHELNNPLTSITVYAEYLVRKLEAQGAETADVEKLRRIGASAQRILRFSRDLVQYARPSGRDLEPIDLAGVVRQSVSICEHLVERGGVSLGVEVDPGLPVVRAVGGQLEQVLINLITNAVHAVENGGRVVVRAQADSPSTVLLEVADSGPGIPDEDRDRIFEPFFTTKSDGKGTGLGLPIVRNIVDQHHGEISVARSDLGGAAFRVILPIT
ncbi:MAG: PAS domain S-box protein [Deltaproteobacteria bacterium]|nr:MAG: PAS domain S-box protein [Deltaproteobacteria bacterium]